MLCLIGVPGIYFHSLFGSRNYHKGVKQTGRLRSINREKLEYDQLIDELENDSSIRHKVFNKYKKLLEIRSQQQAFSPDND